MTLAECCAVGVVGLAAVFAGWDLWVWCTRNTRRTTR